MSLGTLMLEPGTVLGAPAAATGSGPIVRPGCGAGSHGGPASSG
jgi:hypothetical protein